MPWIQHFGRSDIKNGTHYEPGDNTVLIQIKDYNENFVEPKCRFVDIVKFEFEDVEDETNPNSITDHDAKLIATVLRSAYEQNQNVIVHCVVGLCRSSAVAVAGHLIGFDLEDKVRLPNILVMKKVFQALGLYFDPNESSFKTIPDPYDIMTDNEN
jgi:predicted protein tyrosine phosphatase